MPIKGTGSDHVANGVPSLPPWYCIFQLAEREYGGSFSVWNRLQNQLALLPSRKKDGIVDTFLGVFPQLLDGGKYLFFHVRTRRET